MTTSFAFLGGAYAVGGSDKMDVKSVQAVHAQQAYITPPRCVWRSDVGEIDRLANDLRVQSGVLPLLLIDEQCVICRCEHHVPVRLPGHTTRQRGDRRTVSQNAIKVIRSDANDDCVLQGP